MNPFSPRLPGDRAFLLLVAVSTVALTVLRTASDDTITRWWIPLFEVAVLARAVFPRHPWSRSRTHLVTALVFCLGGDILINWTKWGDACIVPFSVTYLNLLWIFVRARRPQASDLPRLLPWIAVSAVVVLAIAPGVGVPWKIALISAYALLLDLMLWRALALLPGPRPAGAVPLALGALLFFATDHLVVLQIFRPATAWVVATWICYPPALALLAWAARDLGGAGERSDSGG